MLNFTSIVFQKLKCRNYIEFYYLIVPCTSFLRLVYIGKVCMRKWQQYRDAISPSLLTLATLGGATYTGSFLLAKARKEGDITLNFANGNIALNCISVFACLGYLGIRDTNSIGSRHYLP